MPPRITLEERIFLVKTTYKLNCSSACREFENRFGRSVRWNTVNDLIKKFEDTGNVSDRPREGAPSTSVNEKNAMAVAQTFIENPKQSAVQVSKELNISRTSLRRIIKNLKFRIWRPRLIHAMNEDDPDRRLQFCHQFNDTLLPYVDQIVWSDEANFSLLNSTVNRHNCVYYSPENPHIVFEKHVNSPSLTVWAGICSFSIIGPYFFDEPVNGTNYLHMITSFAFLAIREIVGANGDGADYWRQQNGAPPHYSTPVREAIDNEFPDMTSMDYAVWGIIKENVFKVRSQSLAELQERIIGAINNFDEILYQTICRSVPNRIEKCILSDGHHFE